MFFTGWEVRIEKYFLEVLWREGIFAIISSRKTKNKRIQHTLQFMPII